MTGPQAAMLDDGRRLHLQHGPIDLIVEAFGADAEVSRAYGQAVERFRTVLTGLVEELPRLRTPCPPEGLGLKGPVARRMEAAVRPFADTHFVTPMAAVAGSVAEEVLAALVRGRSLRRAYVNNGGDIAIHLGDGERFEIGLVADPRLAALAGSARIAAADPVRGIATSGRHGRSLSLGIADAVTVLAERASMADTAATLIANAVDLPGHPAIARVPASEIDPDSDLGDRPVTADIGALSRSDIATALDRGAALAEHMRTRGLIHGAALMLCGEVRLCGLDRPSLPVHQSERLVHA